LRETGWVLRLHFVGGCFFLTLKCETITSRSYKIRREVETQIENGERLSRILRMLGLRRHSARKDIAPYMGYKGSSGSQQLAYDDTPFRNYIELEGPKLWIDQTARQLGCQRKDYITVGYPTLYSTQSKESGGPLSKLLPRIPEA
jgi:hypothetical protein